MVYRSLSTFRDLSRYEDYFEAARHTGSTAVAVGRHNTNGELLRAGLCVSVVPKVILTSSCRTWRRGASPDFIQSARGWRWNFTRALNPAAIIPRLIPRFKLADVIAGNGQWRAPDLIIARVRYVHVPSARPVCSARLARVRSFVRARSVPQHTSPPRRVA